MKRWYCEYNNGLENKNCFCVVTAENEEQVKRIIINYGFVFVKCWLL